MNITTIGAALDNIADWNGDNNTRASTLLDATLSVQQQYDLLEAAIYDCSRILEQVGIIRTEITVVLEDE